MLFLGVVPTAVAYVLFARGLRGLQASEAATITLAEPVTAAALGVFVLGEAITGGGRARRRARALRPRAARAAAGRAGRPLATVAEPA